MFRASLSSFVVTQVRDCLIVTIGNDLSRFSIEELQGVVSRSIHENGCASIILDLTNLNFMDTIEWEDLKVVYDIASVLGAQSIFVGMKVGIISHLIMNDAQTAGLNMALSLDQALKILRVIDADSGN